MTTHPLSPGALHRAAANPVALAAQGGFWVGVQRARQPYGQIAAGPMYVQYQIPAELRHPLPLVMVHGGGGQATDYLHTPDGRPGWASWFLRQGYAVYVVDRPGHGRSPFHPDALGPLTPPATYELILGLFCAPERHPEAYPQARLHNQWPGNPAIGEPILDQFMAGLGSARLDLADAHRDMQRCGIELLDRIGPAILMTHSAGGPFGWLVADARPELVKAIVAVEPISPPFVNGPFGHLSWGLTAIPMTFDPPAASAADLVTEVRPAPRPDLKDCTVQAEPARRLPRLADIPTVVVVAEASWMAQDNHGVVDFLVQAGVPAELLRLEDHGVRGNGHAMMLEKNSDAVAAVIERWIRAHG